MHNLLDPAILFFIFGVGAGTLRSNLEIPPAISRFLSLYLLMALGLKGGFALSHAGLDRGVGLSLAAAVTLAIVVPLLGWAYTSATGFPVVLFGQFPLPDLVGPDKALAELIKPWHKFSAFALAALVLMHVAAALKHQWIDRDGLLRRMSLRG